MTVAFAGSSAGLFLFGVGATCYEVSRFPTSHNLLPFDLIGFALYATPLVIGALVGRKVAENRRPPAA